MKLSKRVSNKKSEPTKISKSRRAKSKTFQEVSSDGKVSPLWTGWNVIQTDSFIQEIDVMNGKLTGWFHCFVIVLKS